MLKAGIFLDVENLSRNGGWGMRYHVIKQLVEYQGARVLRANAYMAADLEREREDDEMRRRNEEFRNAIRRQGYHLVLKTVKRYSDENGNLVVKANADMELAVDALLQAENLDYIIIGTGDSDFIRLVRALQNRGKRVDLLSFGHTSAALRREVDYHYSGYMVPNLLPLPENPDGSLRTRGIMYSVVEEKGYGFIQIRNGFGTDDFKADIFCHITDFKYRIDNDRFGLLKTRENVLEFDLVEQDDGRFKAENVEEIDFARTRKRQAAENNAEPREKAAAADDDEMQPPVNYTARSFDNSEDEGISYRQIDFAPEELPVIDEEEEFVLED